MKRLIALALLVCISAFGADDWAITLPAATSTVCVPSANIPLSQVATNVWAAGGSYTNGDYVSVGDVTYWTPNGGVAGTNETYTTNYNPMAGGNVITTNFVEQPSHRYGSVIGADGIKWKYCGNGRKALYITAETTEVIYFSFAGTATTNSGGCLLPQNPVAYLEDVQDSVEFYTASGTPVIHIIEQ